MNHPTNEAASPPEATPEATAEATAPDPSPADAVARIARERDDYLDQLQRSRAEFANFQKRSKAQAEVDRAYAVEALAADLLNVLDNFDRGLQVARASGATSIVEGLDMVYKQALDVLGRHGVRPIEVEGREFDPARHEAIAQEASADAPEGTILKEASRGFLIRDRVLRPTRVVVSKGPAT